MAQAIPALFTAGSAVAPTAGAAALAKGAALASGASTALTTGIAAGTTLGSGALASMPALSYAGANLAAPGILGALPSAVAPTAGLFAKAAPALGGLKAGTVIPTVAAKTAAVPGVFAKAAPALGGLPAGTTIPGLASTAPNLAAPTLANLNAGFVPSSLTSVGGKAAVPSLTDVVTKVPEVLKPTITGQGLPALSPSASVVQPGLQQELAAQAAKTAAAQSPIQSGANAFQNLGNLMQNPSMDAAIDYAKEHPYATAAAGYGAYKMLKSDEKKPDEKSPGLIRPYEFTRTQRPEAYAVSPSMDTSERNYFADVFTPLEPYEAPGPEYKKAAKGGIASAYAVGGPVETMSAMNAVGGNMMYPQAGLQTALYSNPLMQRPEAVNVISPGEGPAVGSYTGEQKFAEGGDTKEPKTEGMYSYAYDPRTLTFTQLTTPRYADTTNKTLPPLNTGAKTAGGIAPPVGGPGIAALMPQTQAMPLNIPAYQSPEERLGLTDFYAMMNRRLAGMSGYAAGGGVSDLGGYSDGGRLLKGPGDGVSDSIPAVIGKRQPARLADGEFVIPARIVSELGNGSTEAGARKLYAMMDRVQKARSKSIGKKKVAVNSKADKHLPA